MKVIINADDFGFSRGVNLGILEGFQNGIITSTSLMVNMPGFEHAVALMKEYPTLLKVGLHLVTSVQYAVVKGLQTLTDENNHFYHDEKKIAECDPKELLEEYEAQYQRFTEATGLKPTHLDFHWCHTPVQIKTAIYLAKKYHVPLRAGDKEIEALCQKEGAPFVPNHITEFYQQAERQTEVSTMIGLLQRSLEANLDIINFAVHPAYVDWDLLHLSSYNIQRAKEFKVLTDSKIMEFIKAHAIELICFSEA